MDLSTISVHSLNRPTTKVATTPAQYAGLMQDLANHMIDSAQGMIELEELMAVGTHNAQVLENIEMASVVIEQSVAAPWAVQMVNAGSGFVEALVATEGISINTTTQAERQRLARITVEGLGSKIKDAYKKVIAWFKEMWTKFSTWIKNLFNKKARMLAALESQKKRIVSIANPEVDSKKETTVIGKTKVDAFVKAIDAIITNLSGANFSEENEVTAATKLEGDLKDIGAESSGTLAKLGYNNAGDITTVLDSAIALMKSLDKMKTVSANVEKTAKEGIAAAEKAMAGTKDADAKKTEKERIARARKRMANSVKNSAKIDSAAMRLAATALKLAKYVKAKA